MSLPFHFKNILEQELLDEVEKMDLIRIEKNQIILKENTYIRAIPLVIDGNIKVRKTDENGKEIILYHIEPGESCVLSVTSAFNNKLSNAEALTAAPSTIVLVPVDKAKLWMDQYKSWRTFILGLYYERLEGLLTLVDSITFKQIDDRLYAKLKVLRDKEGDVIHLTHQDLAHEIGTAREVISRLLKQMEKEGLLALERGIIKILKPL